MSPLEYLQDDDGELFLQDSDDGRLYGVTPQETLIDADGGEYVVDEDGDLIPVVWDENGEMVAAEDEYGYDDDGGEMEALARDALALEQGLGRKLTEREHLGILDVANRQGLSDAKEAYARWREDEGAPHPKAEDEDTRLERVSERYDDLRRQHQAEGTAPESFTADHAGGETDQAAE